MARPVRDGVRHVCDRADAAEDVGAGLRAEGEAAAVDEDVLHWALWTLAEPCAQGSHGLAPVTLGGIAERDHTFAAAFTGQTDDDMALIEMELVEGE